MKIIFMNTLFQIDEKKYGKEYKNHFFEQYKIYIESADKISERRQKANNFFITINTFIITILWFLFKLEWLKELGYIKELVLILWFLISIIFWFLIRSYKQLNTWKFSVIHKIEEKLPLSLYSYERKILWEWKDYTKYYSFSHIELLLPIIFWIWYIIILLLFICN